MAKATQNFKSPLKSFQSLQSFKLNHQEKAQIYHQAVEIPQFLIDNLKSEHRVIKEFTGQEAILRAFYFNLMKLAFQLENQEVNYAQLVQEILIGEQQFGIGELQDKNFSDKQYRSFLSEFVGILQSQQIPNFQDTIQNYPIIDQILLKMFKQLVPFALKLQDSSDFEVAKRILQYLTKKFKIGLQIISGCFKFLESDIFMYMRSVNHIYLIFMDQLAFIKEVTEDAGSSQMSRSNTSMNYNERILSKTQIRNRQSCRNKDKKVFTTVINMLDSGKKLPTDSSKFSSFRGRNSLDDGLDKGSSLFNKGSDRIAEKDKSSVQDYYDTSVNPKPQNSISRISNPNQPSKTFILKSQTLQISNKQNNKLSPPISRQMEDQNSKKGNLIQPSASTPNKNQRSSVFQMGRGIKMAKRTLTKAQTYTQNNANLYAGSSFSSKLESISRQKKSKVKFTATYQDYYNDGQVTPSADLFKKPPIETVNSKLPSPWNRNSNLQIFSDLKDRNCGFQPKNRQFQNLPTDSLAKQQAKENRDDSSYQRFTDSGLLQLLDQEYRTKIKSIKQKHRQKRGKVQPGV